MDVHPMLIGGRWVQAQSGASMDIVDPGTGEVTWRVAQGGAADARAAVAAARTALDDGPWRGWTAADRAGLLRRVADGVEADAERILSLDIQNSGTPSLELKDLCDLIPMAFRYYAGLIDGADPVPAFPVGDQGSYVLREPVGVAGLIVPWNYPLWLAVAKIAPALAAGCTVVVKPASPTPISVLELAAVFEAAGSPPGVLNVVTGPGAEIGDELVSNASVDKIAFTGGTVVGRRISELASPSFKRLTMELGGKSANIVFADADPKIAIDGALWGIFANNGEVCSAGSRLLLHRSISQMFQEELVERTRALRVGYQMDLSTQVGPLVTAAHRERVHAAVQAGIAEGARLLTGGHYAEVAGYPGGYYYEPTIFTGVTNDMTIAREEIFGPVLAIMEFDDESEAITIANDSQYGLAAGIWSADEARWRRVARELQAGVVFVNSYHSAGIEVPWGGRKNSGFGRELGEEGLSEFQESKAIVRVGAG